jgi:hypothetical protein
MERRGKREAAEQLFEKIVADLRKRFDKDHFNGKDH